MMSKIAIANFRSGRIDRYLQRLKDAGLDAAVLEEGAPTTLDGLGGLVLTGGLDIDPTLYGEGRHATVDKVDRARDDFELALLLRALERDLPVLAICRGHQLLNVALGGTLLQHIENGAHAADLTSEGYPSRLHDVQVAPASRLQSWFGARALVNSRHHQAVTPERLAPGLIAAAMTGDGLVEAIESADHAWVVGVQWHPERDEPQLAGFGASGRLLFREFAAAVAAPVAASH